MAELNRDLFDLSTMPVRIVMSCFLAKISRPSWAVSLLGIISDTEL